MFSPRSFDIARSNLKLRKPRLQSLPPTEQVEARDPRPAAFAHRPLLRRTPRERGGPVATDRRSPSPAGRVESRVNSPRRLANGCCALRCERYRHVGERVIDGRLDRRVALPALHRAKVLAPGAAPHEAARLRIEKEDGERFLRSAIEL